MRNITLLSINSPHELTGGGHYLRSLIHGYSQISDSIKVIGKLQNDGQIASDLPNVEYVCFEKTIFSDVFSRIFLSPSFLLFYLFKILKIVNDSDVIAIHSSRLGIFALLISAFYRDKKIIVHFDNVESVLLKQRLKVQNGFFKRLLLTYDLLIVYLNETLSLKFSSEHSFITFEDGNYLKVSEPIVIPICFPNTSEEPQCDLLDGKKDYILFTGSFDFEPNILALREILELSKKLPMLKFVVAGRGLGTIGLDAPPNVMLINSPSNEEMGSIFSNAKFYLSTVSVGSGMKTKVAEALKFSLPVIAHEHSLIGYDDVIGKCYVKSYSKAYELTDLILSDPFRYIDSLDIKKDFESYYTYNSVRIKLKGLLEKL
ncbi:hypothetical protein [Aeromonas veronii]